MEKSRTGIIQRIKRVCQLSSVKKAVLEPKTVISFVRELKVDLHWQQIDEDEEFDMSIRGLAEMFDRPTSEIREYKHELNESKFRAEFDRRWHDLKEANQITGTTSIPEAELLYLVCRMVEPSRVVETGVRYGSFTAHILAALEHNGAGDLYSVDLPMDKAPFEQGYLVPPSVRDRWTLHVGDAQEKLPLVLEDVEPIDLFLHDSDHRKAHMEWEFSRALEALEEDGVLASHDVLKHNAFAEACRKGDLESVVGFSTGVGIRR